MSSSIFITNKKENLKSKAKKIALNFFPAYRGTGGRVSFISADWQEVHVKLSLNWRTKNYVGTVFGGSIYGAADPIYMIQLINILGKHYIVWDKSASVKFIKPIKKTVFARFLITDNLLNEIRTKVETEQKHVINLLVSFQDENEIIYAEVVKTIYIADINYYKSKK